MFVNSFIFGIIRNLIIEIMNEVLQEVANVLVSHVGEIVVFIGTSLAALIKRKLDLRKIKREQKKRLRKV
jgi:uncharacterized protein (DUF2384 family)